MCKMKRLVFISTMSVFHGLILTSSGFILPAHLLVLQYLVTRWQCNPMYCSHTKTSFPRLNNVIHTLPYDCLNFTIYSSNKHTQLIESKSYLRHFLKPCNQLHLPMDHHSPDKHCLHKSTMHYPITTKILSHHYITRLNSSMCQ